MRLIIDRSAGCLGSRSSMIAQHASINGVTLYYEVHGQGEPVVLLHGAFGSLEIFRGIIPFLSANFQVIAADSRGHGRSTDNEDLLSYELLAKDVVGLLDELDLQRASVVGWSDGGITALQLALNFPSRLSRLISISANSDPAGLTSRAIERIYNTSIENLDPFSVAFYRKVSPHPDHLPTLIEKLKYMLLTEPNFSPEQLGRIDCPTLIVAGDAEEYIRMDHTLKLCSAIPRAEIKWIRNTGHFLVTERPVELCECINEFLSSHQVRSPGQRS
jgi:pimeloyl-ACP methyl ester carboxylesterase